MLYLNLNSDIIFAKYIRDSIKLILHDCNKWNSSYNVEITIDEIQYQMLKSDLVESVECIKKGDKHTQELLPIYQHLKELFLNTKQ